MTEVPLEKTIRFTAATKLQVMATVALGVANVVGVCLLGSLLVEPRARYVLATQGLGFVVGLMPWLQAYAVTFFAIPLFR